MLSSELWVFLCFFLCYVVLGVVVFLCFRLCFFVICCPRSCGFSCVFLCYVVLGVVVFVCAFGCAFFCDMLSSELWVFLCFFFVICCPRSCGFFCAFCCAFFVLCCPRSCGFSCAFFVLCCPRSCGFFVLMLPWEFEKLVADIRSKKSTTAGAVFGQWQPPSSRTAKLQFHSWLRSKTCLQQQENLRLHIWLQSKNLSAAKGSPADSHLAAKQKPPTAAEGPAAGGDVALLSQ